MSNVNCRLRAFSLLLVSFIAAGCGRLPNEPARSLPAYSVVSVLWNIRARNYLFVYPVTAPGKRAELVQNADVSVAWNEREVYLQLVRNPFGPDSVAYADSHDHIEVLPSTRYRLTIVLPSGEVIRGSTLVPGAFDVLSPADGDTVWAEEGLARVEVAWTESEGVAGYLVCVERPELILPTGERYRLPPATHLVNQGRRWSASFFPESTHDSVFITVLAFDENYHRHVFGGENAAGLEGAFGVFGSMWGRTVKVVLSRQQSSGSRPKSPVRLWREGAVPAGAPWGPPNCLGDRSPESSSRSGRCFAISHHSCVPATAQMTCGEVSPASLKACCPTCDRQPVLQSAQ